MCPPLLLRRRLIAAPHSGTDLIQHITAFDICHTIGVSLLTSSCGPARRLVPTTTLDGSIHPY
jgi:hypothetical protein